MSWLIIGICSEVTPVRLNGYQCFSVEKQGEFKYISKCSQLRLILVSRRHFYPKKITSYILLELLNTLHSRVTVLT